MKLPITRTPKRGMWGECKVTDFQRDPSHRFVSPAPLGPELMPKGSLGVDQNRTSWSPEKSKDYGRAMPASLFIPDTVRARFWKQELSFLLHSQSLLPCLEYSQHSVNAFSIYSTLVEDLMCAGGCVQLWRKTPGPASTESSVCWRWGK